MQKLSWYVTSMYVKKDNLHQLMDKGILEVVLCFKIKISFYSLLLFQCSL